MPHPARGWIVIRPPFLRHPHNIPIGHVPRALAAQENKSTLRTPARPAFERFGCGVRFGGRAGRGHRARCIFGPRPVVLNAGRPVVGRPGGLVLALASRRPAVPVGGEAGRPLVLAGLGAARGPLAGVGVCRPGGAGVAHHVAAARGVGRPGDGADMHRHAQCLAFDIVR